MKRRFLKLTNFFKSHPAAIISGLAIVSLILIIAPPKISQFLAGPKGKYKLATVKKKTLSQTVSASGTVQAENQAVLKFQTSGRLAWVGVKEGDFVRRGQAIASLDKRELEKKFKKELNDYLNERWDFEQTQADYQETKERHLITDEIQRILDKAQFDLNNAVIDVEIADLAVKFATIVSPINGIVTQVESPLAGVNITPATAEFIIADPAVMKFVANVDEADIGNVKVGQKALVSLDAYPEEEFEGVVNKIAFAAVTTRGGGTAFPVEIILPENTDQRFKVGMNGDVEIVLDSRQDVLTVPLEAIRTKGGKTYVQVVEEPKTSWPFNRRSKIRETEVQLGIEGETEAEVISGLNPGELVITGPKEK